MFIHVGYSSLRLELGHIFRTRHDVAKEQACKYFVCILASNSVGGVRSSSPPYLQSVFCNSSAAVDLFSMWGGDSFLTPFIFLACYVNAWEESWMASVSRAAALLLFISVDDVTGGGGRIGSCL